MYIKKIHNRIIIIEMFDVDFHNKFIKFGFVFFSSFLPPVRFNFFIYLYVYK